MSKIVLCLVDQSTELQAAVHYACLHARKRNEDVGLVYVIEPGDFQHFAAVESLMKEELRAEAEGVLRKWAIVTEGLTGTRPLTYVREGDALAELMTLMQEEPDIGHLVLGAGPHDAPGTLIHHLSGKWIHRLKVPMTIVPCHLEKADLESMA
jgi:nucleotide-binding universal stress UspA family protein